MSVSFWAVNRHKIRQRQLGESVTCNISRKNVNQKLFTMGEGKKTGSKALIQSKHCAKSITVIKCYLSLFRFLNLSFKK